MSQNNGKQYYVGLTIGPVIKTLATAKKTRHLWAASYSFAYLMKEIAQAFDQKYSGRIWLKPALGEAAREAFLETNRRSRKLTGAGAFPDHLIFSSEDKGDVEELRTMALKVINDFGEATAHKIRAASIDEVKNYFLNYFQVYIVRKELSVDQNPILEMSELLSTVELQQCFASVKENYLTDLFDVVTDSFLTKDAFGGKHNFLSIPEIALTTHLMSPRTLKNGETCREYVDSQRLKAKQAGKTKEDSDDLYIDWVKAFIEAYHEENKDAYIKFFTGQKYVAIVQADGDNIGALLRSIPAARRGEFSEKLTEFAADAAELVKTYEGMPVYFGGDDALFFVPVIHGKQHVFQLLRAMNESFSNSFQNFVETGKSPPKLSFGLSITYVKYPLYEALEQARFLLFAAAKEGLITDETDEKTGKKKHLKNNTAFRILRHSGSAFGGMLHLDDDSDLSVMNAFIKVFEMNVKTPNQALRSIIYRIPENETLFALIGKKRAALEHFLDNSFDEDVHLDRKKYIGAVADLIHHIYTHWERYPKEVDEESFGSPARMSYNLLKTIAFLTTEEK